MRGSPRDAVRTVSAPVALAGIKLADDRPGLRGEPELSTRVVALTHADHLAVIVQLPLVKLADLGGLTNAEALPELTDYGVQGGLALSTHATTPFSPSRSARSQGERLRPAAVIEP